MFWNSALRRNRRTDEIKQLPSKNMKEVEDLNEDALPPSTDLRTRQCTSSKFCQLGVEAWSSMLSSLLDGPDFTDVAAILVIDLYPRVGELLEAFCKKRNHFHSAPLFYFGVAEHQTEWHWITSQTKDLISDEITAGTFKLLNTNNSSANADINNDLLEPFPPPPQMNVLVLGGEHKDQLLLPTSIVKKWQFHPMFSKEFVSWLDDFTQKYKLVDDNAESNDPARAVVTPIKRKNTSADLGEAGSSGGKKPKVRQVSPELIIETDSIEHALLVETKVGKDLMLQIRAAHNLYLVNKGACETALSEGTFLAGFGKGGFKLLKEENDESLPFRLQDQDTLVVLNGQVTKLGEVLTEHRVKKPDCQLCYHKIVPHESDPKMFTLELTHKVAFTPKLDDAEIISQANAAAKEVIQSWRGSPVVKILWNVRWTTKGLMPVKPAVHLILGVSLPVGRSLLLRPSSATSTDVGGS